MERKVRTGLSAKGFTHREIDQVEGYLYGDMNEHKELNRGLDKREVEDRMKWFRENKHNHSLSDKQIDDLEGELKEYL